MGLLFYPRGGSAQVVRYLAAALPPTGWDASVYCGSLGPPDAETNAARFFAGLDVHALDYSNAVAAFERGDDPLVADPPLHPSFEDRAGAPDRVLAAVAPELLERQVAAWTPVFEDGGAGDADVFHLHHLTPQHEVVARQWPDRPVLGHLHGTELKMIEAVVRGGGRGVGRAPWLHGDFWVETMRSWAGRCERLVVISPHDRDKAVALLGIEPARVERIANGVDTERFTARDLPHEERLSLLRRWLVDEARGWDETGEPGTIRYSTAAVDGAFGNRDHPVLVYVGRFLGFKRVPLLIRAYARARKRFATRAPLLIWGGSPGEFEGEHPYTVARAEGVDDDVFFVGWRGHDELPLGLNCADALVAPSVDEPFGQVFLEAMACKLPVVTTATGGPLSFVNTDPAAPNGWLVPPDDAGALADALVEVVADAGERRARGERAYEMVRAEYSWRVLARHSAALYDDLVAG